MKINKKVLIPVFATAMGLSVVGGISGAVAWYQYNSKVTASFIGVSTADTGVLQIKEGTGSWGRSVDRADKGTLKPITFGATTSGVPADAWAYPEAGAGNALGHGNYYEGAAKTETAPGYVGWQKATASDYAFFDLYFDAFQTNPAEDSSGYTYVARPVFLSDYYLRCLDTDGNAITTKIAEEAIRIQFDIMKADDSAVETSLILGKTAGNTNLYGALDLDGNGNADSYHKTPFNDVTTALDNTEIEYGGHEEVQNVKAISAYMDKDHPLFSTSADKTKPVHVKVSVWLEGWAILDSATRAEWNPFKTAGCDVQVALEFTTGIFRGNDLSVLP